LFLGGVRTIDRVRGGGWLDCGSCGEHTAEDVVDEMRFLSFLGYRLTPVGRRRVLVCRHCGVRRPVTGVQLAGLRTCGRSIRSAWMVPIGLVPLLVVGIAALFLATRHAPSIEDTLAFGNDTAQPVAPLTLRRPVSWNAAASTDATPPDYTISDPTQTMVIRLRRITDSTSLTELVAQHLTDDNGINDSGVPQSPPPASAVTLAGENALRLRFDYTTTGEAAQTTLYAFFHDGIGYTLTYVAKGTGAFSTLDQVAERVNSSLRFAGTETPAPCPSPTAAPSPSPSTSAGPSPSAGAQPSLPAFATSPQPCAAASAATPGAEPTPTP
jgi:hypothetical protein